MHKEYMLEIYHNGRFFNQVDVDHNIETLLKEAREMKTGLQPGYRLHITTVTYEGDNEIGVETEEIDFE